MNERLALWGAVYRVELDRAAQAHSDDYPWYTGQDSVAVVAGRMQASFERSVTTGSCGFNKDGQAIKATCKAFGLPYTYKAILAFLKGN